MVRDRRFIFHGRIPIADRSHFYKGEIVQPDGKLDDAHKLFGNVTPYKMPDDENAALMRQYDADDVAGRPHQPYQMNGFKALSWFDRPEKGGNGDGKIDSQDAVFSELRGCKFRPPNIDMASNCKTLPELGIKAIFLTYRESSRTDKYGNQMRYEGSIESDKPGANVPVIYDVYFRYTSKDTK